MKRFLISRHSTGILSVDSSAFTDAGCTFDSNGLNCSSIGLGEQFDCSLVNNASDALGSLSPKMPIAECLVYDYSGNYSPNEGVMQVGCMHLAYVKCIVREVGEFKLISTK